MIDRMIRYGAEEDDGPPPPTILDTALVAANEQRYERAQALAQIAQAATLERIAELLIEVAGQLDELSAWANNTGAVNIRLQPPA